MVSIGKETLVRGLLSVVRKASPLSIQGNVIVTPKQLELGGLIKIKFQIFMNSGIQFGAYRHR